MKLAFNLAFKNLMGTGLRTWLNAGVLSFAFIVIIFYNGLIDGWNKQASMDTIEWKIANGLLLNKNYDESDPFTVLDGHGVIKQYKQKNLTPVLVTQAVIYPQGRMMPINIKGIEINQSVVKLPTQLLKNSNAEIPVIMGTRMAKTTNSKVGDEFLLRWRDANGTYDARNVTVVGIFKTNISEVDAGQLWLPLNKLWEITQLQNHATYFIANENYIQEDIAGWRFENQEYQLRELTKLINTEKASGSIIYIILMALGLLAIFDTQVLSIFRRQKEIGTYIALGMTRRQVVGIFTAEGSMYSIFAILIGAVYGMPLLSFVSKKGISFEIEGDQFGIVMAERIYPVYGLGLILGTTILVILSATIVSFLPARKISKMNPVNALKGKLQ